MTTWMLIGMTIMSIGAAIGLALKGQYALGFVQLAYALANIGWIYATK